MPALPSISEWLPSGIVIGFGMFLFGVVRADLKAMETRQREDNKALNEKPDRLVESLPAARQS
ncbi:MAG: hypothetical protein OXF67_06590 [Cyanobacteria bacterium MAG CAR4_bin_6]|nr:hypothetical protein [Cyanobacteria bacterium MAG CAR4_bin_6]